MREEQAKENAERWEKRKAERQTMDSPESRNKLKRTNSHDVTPVTEKVTKKRKFSEPAPEQKPPGKSKHQKYNAEALEPSSSGACAFILISSESDDEF